MEHSEGKEIDGISDEKIVAQKVPHVLIIQLGGGAVQHQFEFPSREEAIAPPRNALKHGWVEIENERVYLLVMAGPGSGACFLVMPRADVLAQQAQRQAAAAQQAQAQAQGIAKRLVLPNGR